MTTATDAAPSFFAVSRIQLAIIAELERVSQVTIAMCDDEQLRRTRETAEVRAKVLTQVKMTTRLMAARIVDEEKQFAELSKYARAVLLLKQVELPRLPT